MASEKSEMALAAQSAEDRGEQLEPTPGYAVIGCGASELIPSQQYGNVTIGPITVKRSVPDDENLAAEVQATQKLCEAAVAEERETVHALLRANIAASNRA